MTGHGKQGSVLVTMWVDGTERRLDVDPRTSLLDALRERLGVTSAKKGCDHGQCGACTVLLDGRRVNSCLILAIAQDGSEVTTAAGLADGEELHPLQRSFVERLVPALGAFSLLFGAWYALAAV